MLILDKPPRRPRLLFLFLSYIVVRRGLAILLLFIELGRFSEMRNVSEPTACPKVSDCALCVDATVKHAHEVVRAGENEPDVMRDKYLRGMSSSVDHPLLIRKLTTVRLAKRGPQNSLSSKNRAVWLSTALNGSSRRTYLVGA